MGCASCAQKYAALRASRKKNKESSAVDTNSPRSLRPPRRGILRRSEKLGEAQVASPVVKEDTDGEQAPTSDNPD